MLLLSGIGANIEMWEPAARHLTGRRLVMLDVPGTGGSPALRVGLRMRGYAQLVTQVLDALGLDRVDVLLVRGDAGRPVLAVDDVHLLDRTSAALWARANLPESAEPDR